MPKENKIVITCPKGLSPYLSREVRSLGLHVISETVSGITTEGSLEDAMAANLQIRTGHRVLFFLSEFKARNADELYASMIRIPWEEYIPLEESITVHSSVDNATVRDSRYPNLKCKDAVVDRMREVFGMRPDAGPGREGAVIFFYWKNDDCSVYLDTSGEPLSRRGYRKMPWKAPLQETLAAAIVMASEWDGRNNFVNPMCGSGTLAIEAALIASNLAPGLLRANFAFRHLLGFSATTWEGMRRGALAKRREGVGRIIATDSDERAVAAAMANAANAGVEKRIEFGVCDFSETEIPPGEGVVVVNPEYGERLGSAKDLLSVYKGLGDFLKQRCSGYAGYVLTGDKRLGKMVGLRPEKKTIFFNGPIECRLLKYELYKGSRKKGPKGEDGKEL
jgi:putative N6-adenine-specific DNA methylase